MTAGIAELADAAPRERVYLEDARGARTVDYGQLADAVRGTAAWFAGHPATERVALDIDDGTLYAAGVIHGYLS